jgi:hypothetical protein
VSASRARLWTRLGFGSGPGNTEEGRAFLQRRIAFYLGTLSALWLAVLASGYTSARIFMPQLIVGAEPTRAGLGHIFGTLAMIVAWLYARSGRRSLLTLSLLEVGVTLGQALICAFIMSSLDMGYRPDLSMILGGATALIARAATVPTRATRTAVVGVAASLPLLIAAALVHLDMPAAPRVAHPGVLITQDAMWLVFIVGLSTLISRVIWGLSRKVQEAERLGQYTLERKIGEGGMGVVYLARHALLRRPTAIKLLPPAKAGQQDLARFEREVQTTSALRHPNTVAIYDYGHTPDGVFYYAMEYLDGVDLERLIRLEGPQPEGRVVHILAQIAGALAEAHDAGLIHRDIKPSNILLCNQGHQADFAKVLDFGLVKEVDGAQASASMAQALTGTPLYMSPESIVTPASIDGRSDIYALGAVGYALLTGEPPFEGRTAVEVCGHHLHTQPLPPSRRRDRPMASDLEALILACLAKQPGQRPASADALAASLRRCAVPPWTEQDARAWWREHGARLRASAARGASGTSEQTVAVDLAGR